VVGSLTLAAAAQPAYVAHSVNENGRSPLPENIDSIDSKYLVVVEWSDYVGARSRVAVMEVDNTSSAPSFIVQAGGSTAAYTDGGEVPVNGIEAIVTDVMNRTGRFRLIERQQLDEVLKEQDLAASGRVASPSGAKMGNVLGAQYLVQVVITSYETRTSSSDSGVGGFLTSRVPLIGGVNVSQAEGSVALNFRLIDAETSEVVYTRQIESKITEGGVDLAGAGLIGDVGLSGFMNQYSRTPIGQAVIAGVNKGVYELVKNIGAAQATGSVVQSKDGQVWINLGQGVVEIGDRLLIERKGEELIDPDTGMSLGGTATPVGEIEVSRVEEKYSIARKVSFSTEPIRGDKVISTAPPPSMEYASQFAPPGNK
jgi:curli biogenesis system outer membrane secretion channel CsgG